LKITDIFDLERRILERTTRVHLTDLERRYAKMLNQGLSYSEVAEAEFVSLATVKTNASRLYSKLGINHREELVRIMRDWEL
jgi:DNA-binding CsgD family transcriptional regulator